MKIHQPMTGFLKLALLADAVASGAMGLLLVLAAGPLTGWLGLPEELMRAVGVFLVPYALAVTYVGTRQKVLSAAVNAIILANTLWVVASFALLSSGTLSPSLLGYLFVTAQAMAVAVFAIAQYIGLRKVVLLQELTSKY